MKIKVNSLVATHAAEALAPHAARLYSTLGARIVVIAELAATERVEVAEEEDKDPSVTLQLKHLEVAGESVEDAVRQAMRALHVQRTAFGTITEDQDVELAASTLERCAGNLHAIEAARLHVVVDKWSEYARHAGNSMNLTLTDARHELKTLADALAAAIHTATLPIDA